MIIVLNYILAKNLGKKQKKNICSDKHLNFCFSLFDLTRVKHKLMSKKKEMLTLLFKF